MQGFSVGYAWTLSEFFFSFDGRGLVNGAFCSFHAFQSIAVYGFLCCCWCVSYLINMLVELEGFYIVITVPFFVVCYECVVAVVMVHYFEFFSFLFLRQ